MTDLSVVVLCYHSGESIIPIYSRLDGLLQKMAIKYEIVLVANDFAKSHDKTLDIVKSISVKNEKVIPVTEIKEGMMGWDMMTGMDAASGDIICVIDGDGQFPLESIEQGYNLIIQNQCDLVKTYRINRQDGFYRKTISMVYNILFGLLFPGLDSKDVNSKPKLLRKDVYKKLNLSSNDWFIDAEIMIRARDLSLNIREFPIPFLPNNSRKSFVRFGAIFEFIFNLIRFRLKNPHNR